MKDKMSSKNEKTIIYQILVRLAGNRIKDNKPWGSLEENGCGKFNDLDTHVLEEIASLGANHIWLTGVIEHASCTGYPKQSIEPGNPLVIKGRAGSPYAIKDYYDVCPDLAVKVEKRMEEFEDLVQRCHKAGLAPVIDFVPNHVARQYDTDQPRGMNNAFGNNDQLSKSFDPANNFYYIPGKELQLPDEVFGLPIAKDGGIAKYFEKPAKATGNDCFSHKPAFHDWYETVKLNYGVDFLNNSSEHFEPLPDTWNKMLDILLFWAGKNISGFRCDMAEMVPLPFWKWVIEKVREQYPDIKFIAEIYTPSLYRAFIEAGFDFLYDKIGLYDTLREVLAEKQPAKTITKVWQQLDDLSPFMLRFMENHDEQRIASGHFAGTAAAGIPSMTVSALMNRGPVMLYFGQETGECASGAMGFSGDDGRTSIFDYCNVPSFQKWFNNGKCNSDLLNDNETQIREFYAKLLKLAKHQVISNGEFYDLMWVNNLDDQPGIYAFLRWDQKNIWLVVANFSNKHHAKTHILIPEHFWELKGQVIDNDKLCRLSAMLSSNIKKTYLVTELMHDGAELELPPLSAEVFDLQSP